MKPQIVAELNKLQVELRKSAVNSSGEVVGLTKRLITLEEFPGLCPNRHALLMFLEQKPLAALGFGGPKDLLFTENEVPIEHLSATNLFYHLVAFSTNRTPESVRQEISKLSAEIKRRRE